MAITEIVQICNNYLNKYFPWCEPVLNELVIQAIVCGNLYCLKRLFFWLNVLCLIKYPFKSTTEVYFLLKREKQRMNDQIKSEGLQLDTETPNISVFTQSVFDQGHEISLEIMAQENDPLDEIVFPWIKAYVIADGVIKHRIIDISQTNINPSGKYKLFCYLEKTLLSTYQYILFYAVCVVMKAMYIITLKILCF
nr:uncharacterized protein LOC106679620 [Halyomorpha halys]